METSSAMTVMSILPRIEYDALSPMYNCISSFKLNQGTIPYFSEGSYSVIQKGGVYLVFWLNSREVRTDHIGHKNKYTK